MIAPSQPKKASAFNEDGKDSNPTRHAGARHTFLPITLEITEDEKAAIQLNEPFAALAPNDVRCSSTSDLVGPEGLEPPTLSV